MSYIVLTLAPEERERRNALVEEALSILEVSRHQETLTTPDKHNIDVITVANRIIDPEAIAMTGLELEFVRRVIADADPEDELRPMTVDDEDDPNLQEFNGVGLYVFTRQSLGNVLGLDTNLIVPMVRKEN